MTLPRKSLKQQVVAKIRESTLKELKLAIHKQRPSLWGYDKRRSFEYDCLLIALYHDLEGVGYNKIEKEIKSWRPLVGKSLRHNTKAIRQSLSTWSDEQLSLGDQHDWNQAAKNLSISEAEEGVNLWIDSSDFRKTQPEKHSKKSPEHSFKENHYANRFTCISDAKQRVRILYGPYSPKVDDNAFVSLMKDRMESTMDGAVIIGDCGYEVVAKQFKKIKMITTKSKPRGKKPKNGEGVTKLTKQQKTRNRQLKQLRSRIESPFGNVKAKWKALSNCFSEGDEQHGLLVRLALAIKNFEKKN